MCNQPLISVILPVYNGESTLKATLDSVFEQGYPNIEVIVVDDGSTDDSHLLIQNYKVVYEYQPNMGVAEARNRGVRLSSGDFLAFIDQDDTWHPDKLEKQIRTLKHNDTLGFVLCQQSMSLDSSISQVPDWVREGQLDTAVTGYLPSALLVRKDVYAKVGPFNPDFKTGSDGDWFFRAKDMGVSMVVLPEVLVYRKVHKENHSNEIKQTQEELLRIVRQSVKRTRDSRSHDG